MTAERAREWLIGASLALTLLLLLFFLIAPSLGYPLKYDKAFQLLGTVVPVFTGYLGAAAHFIFRRKGHPEVQLGNERLLKLLTFGPLIVFALATVAILFSFGFSNRMAAPMGIGMTVEVLGIGLTMILGVLTISTSVLVSYLFAAERGRGP